MLKKTRRPGATPHNRRLGRVLALTAVALPIAVTSAGGNKASAAPSSGTIVTIEGDQIIATRPDGGAAHVIAEGSPLSSVSMSDDGIIYFANDENYVDTDDTMWAYTQGGSLVQSWKAPNPGLGQLYGGISDSEARRDGELIITQSIWTNCNGGGISEICSVRYITVPGSAASLGNLSNVNTVGWLGNTDYIVVDGGLEYYRVGDDEEQDWFEDPDLYAQWDATTTTDASGSVLAVAGVGYGYDPEDTWAVSKAIAFYAVDAAPPAVPARTCILTSHDMLGEDLWSGYLSEVSFSPDGTSLAFAAGESFDDLSVYVISGLDTSTCSYASVAKLIDGGVQDMYWGHVTYDATPDPVDNPDDPHDPNDPDPIPEGAVVVPTSPGRFWDTRNEDTFDGQHRDTGRLGAGRSYAVQIAGRGSVPADAAGVVANLTVILPGAPGFATLYPCGGTPPTASHLNYGVGAVLANNAVVPLDDDGKVCVYTLADADFALDVNGFVPADADLTGITPARYLDTRSGAGTGTFDGQSAGTGRVAGGRHVEVRIAGRGGVPAGAAAALVNVTAVTPGGPGFVTLYPCGQRPLASTVNYGAGEVVPNGAFVNLSDDGTICAYTLADADLLIDVSGYVPAGSDGLTPLVAARLADTRPGERTVDDAHAGTGRIAGGQSIEIQITGRGGVPATATAAMFNVGVVFPDGPGYATLYPCGSVPNASNVNFASAGVVRANNAFTKLSADGTVCLFTSTTTDVILDVTGWVG